MVNQTYACPRQTSEVSVTVSTLTSESSPVSTTRVSQVMLSSGAFCLPTWDDARHPTAYAHSVCLSLWSHAAACLQLRQFLPSIRRAHFVLQSQTTLATNTAYWWSFSFICVQIWDSSLWRFILRPCSRSFVPNFIHISASQRIKRSSGFEYNFSEANLMHPFLIPRKQSLKSTNI